MKVMRTGYLISLSGYHLLQEKHKSVVPKVKKVKTAKKSKPVSDTDQFDQSFQGKIILKPQSSSGRSIKARVPWSPSNLAHQHSMLRIAQHIQRVLMMRSLQPAQSTSFTKFCHSQNCELGKMLYQILWTLGSFAVLP